MVKKYRNGVYLVNGTEMVENDENAPQKLQQLTGDEVAEATARKKTITYHLLETHNTSEDMTSLKLKFDSMTSHDITYVGIIQTARASGMKNFPLPYILTNCHNSLCAVGGTINEDDHKFALSAAQKYGGVYLPTNLGVIHSYNREMMAGCGKMILGSDSHTRYGALGTLAVGEGGGELAKQLVGKTYDITYPGVVAVYLYGKPKPGVGPQDVALSIIGAVYADGYVKNKVMEFVGPGIQNLPVEYRNGIDVMTTETTCWSSIWCTDDQVKDYLMIHGRPEDYKKMEPGSVAYYDGLVYVDLDKIEPMIAMPFHPSNTYSIRELRENAADILNKVEKEGLELFDSSDLKIDLKSKLHGKDIYVDQGIVAGCSGGTFDNIVEVADIMEGKSIGNSSFSMSIYPGSQPAYMELVKNGAIVKIMSAGALIREAFCGPCFGAGDTPANNELSIRHTTRNFPNREGSKPSDGQISYVALMDARSIAATAINHGKLTSATEIDVEYSKPIYYFDKTIYDKRVYDGIGKPKEETELIFGPNIKNWPEMPALTEDILLKVVSYIKDPVTTTDELIPSGETSSYRSNPIKLAEFTLSRKDPEYVSKAKEIHQLELRREKGEDPRDGNQDLKTIYDKISKIDADRGDKLSSMGIGSSVFAISPGDGSAREQAASCQKVLGTWANFANQYATKRYRSNLINWGILPFEIKGEPPFDKGDYLYIPGIRKAVLEGTPEIEAYVIGEQVATFKVSLGDLSKEEKEIIVAGCLINYYRNQP
ncbi:hydratase [Tindallia californiensis]|uniref:Aconitate hydratase n=1 Tax=Tindallia californiensis TaxID=159292 RepID=A0A1H3Q7W6_9FIRM|nr:hydratase [Tindallia californiensis]SDZ09624.1 aconitate hydratase [Tindallia californiensis]